MSDNKDILSSNRQEALLLEYERCDELVGRLDGLIWQTASVMFPISMAGFAYFGLLTDHTPDQFFTILIVGIGSIAIVGTWFFLSRSWYKYQSIAYYRMREIECELNLWHYRYAFHMRRSSKEQVKIYKRLSGVEQNRLQKLEEQVGKPRFRVGMRTTTAIVTIIFVLGWIALVIREFVVTF